MTRILKFDDFAYKQKKYNKNNDDLQIEFNYTNVVIVKYSDILYTRWRAQFLVDPLFKLEHQTNQNTCDYSSYSEEMLKRLTNTFWREQKRQCNIQVCICQLHNGACA